MSKQNILAYGCECFSWFDMYNCIYVTMRYCGNIWQVSRPGAKTIKKNANSTQNKFQTHRAKQYEVTSFLSTDCELSTETCSKNVYSLGPMIPYLHNAIFKVNNFLESLPSFWIMRSQRSRRRDKGLWRLLPIISVGYHFLNLFQTKYHSSADQITVKILQGTLT